MRRMITQHLSSVVHTNDMFGHYFQFVGFRKVFFFFRGLVREDFRCSLKVLHAPGVRNTDLVLF